MFSELVYTTPFDSRDSDVYKKIFPNITGQNYGDDVTFLSTLRALLYNRIGPGESINLETLSLNYYGDEEMFERVQEIRDDTVSVVAVGLDYKTEIMDKILLLFEGNRDWEKLDKISEFFQKTTRVLCYINRQRKSVVLFHNNDLKTHHYIQCSTLAFLPWYFDPEKGITKEELELIESLREKKSLKYLESLLKLAKLYDVRKLKIKNMLNNFETVFEQKNIEASKRRLRECENKIQSRTHELQMVLRDKRDILIMLNGLMNTANNITQGEVMEYVIRNNHIDVVSLTRSVLTIIVKGELVYYEEEPLKAILNNQNSVVYYPDGLSSEEISPSDMKWLLEEIFLTQKLKIKVCAAYQIDIDSFKMVGITGYDYGFEYQDYMPNPHIDKYGCVGDFESIISEMLSNRDVIGALEQCIVSCCNLSFLDGIVLTEFMHRLYGRRGSSLNKCIMLPDGRVVRPLEAIQWLKIDFITNHQDEIVAYGCKF